MHAEGQGQHSPIVVGAVYRVVFLALRGEEGQVECFWPVPLEIEAATPAQGQFATARKTARRG